jgi:hypothetical protein
MELCQILKLLVLMETIDRIQIQVPKMGENSSDKELISRKVKKLKKLTTKQKITINKWKNELVLKRRSSND